MDNNRAGSKWYHNERARGRIILYNILEVCSGCSLIGGLVWAIIGGTLLSLFPLVMGITGGIVFPCLASRVEFDYDPSSFRA